ncbi:hypothetical protein LFYK43_00650 [Ligilactobacillus salitolerans]|uniref:DUF4811 domain-containing protein n=1 Tax=Ligilactobacillus salitolerans TaxID=1808352 RepID=A0A401IPZ9_9LACO|nr:DUF4811 domain-containing protein [Ligilactobacillus salitolerans]GBG93606.1 hypothetical protein LFYK43_00650 [Ligilactobacillus salitolerans]
MILATLVIGALSAFICYVYIKPVVWRVIGTLISAVILIGSLVLLALNSHEHYGMHKVTSTKVVQVYPASSKNNMNIMIYQPVGSNGKETVQIYKETKNQKKPSHTQANEYTVANNHIQRTNAKTATLTVKETRWKFKSKTYKFWFGVSGLQNKLVKRTNTFKLPQDWLHLSTTQVKALQKKLAGMKTKAGQAKVKAQAQQYVQQQLKAAIMKDPSLATDKAKQAALAKQYAAQFQQQLIKKAVADLK